MRARTSGVEKVTTAIARRAIISGPARLRIDAWPSNVPPGADGGQCGRVRQRAGRRPLSQKERSDGRPAYAALRRRRRSARPKSGTRSHALCGPELEQPPAGNTSSCVPIGGTAPTPAPAPAPGVVSPVVGSAGVESLHIACRIICASWERAASSAAGLVVDWYVVGYTPLA